MRAPYVHEAAVRMIPNGDLGAPGGAVTLELCGGWDHPAPCPLAAHHTRASRDGGTVLLRVVFATEPEHESEVRRRIERALRKGTVTAPDGVVSHWKFLGTAAGELTPAEADHALRIAST
ncbi:hypothetical protein [Arthrobacter sp. ISL-72]|uniref:hypothetical protein n=1 Tax=Arthrobacter sp. ISL-72 TaxID=2819114 RepID=UPI001BE6A084|nr:hypothetical protein [Arthrobacter sp. ISL-72]MBT2593890.1 hypothetical protein [Arthrobacter sp. ISL-72]